MDPLTKKQFEEIVKSGDFNKLIGHYENEWFDCKATPYILGDNKNKRELAKDVSSFANLEGGYILIGIKTTSDEVHLGDRIDELKHFDPSLINKDQILKICEEWIFPAPENLNLHWIQSNIDSNKGIAIIEIPHQPDSLKPFLIKNVLDGEKQIEIMFGYAERRGDKSQPFNLRDIQTILRSGLNFERNIKGRFDALDLILQQFSTQTPKEDFQKKLKEKTETTLVKVHQTERRNLILAGYLEDNYRIKNFSLSKEIKALPKNYTEPLRNGGWKLLYSTDLITNTANLIQVGYDSRSLSLFDDGTAIYICDLDYLSLVNNDSLMISIALIETVYQFVDFYKEFLQFIETDTNNVRLKVTLRHLLDRNIETKLPFNLRPNSEIYAEAAPENLMEGLVDADKNFDPKTVAFQLLQLIYSWFGFDRNPPYTKIENDNGIIDLAQIARS